MTQSDERFAEELRERERDARALAEAALDRRRRRDIRRMVLALTRYAVLAVLLFLVCFFWVR